MLFAKVAELEIARNLALPLEGEAAKFIRQRLVAVIDPAEDLGLGVLSLG